MAQFTAPSTLLRAKLYRPRVMEDFVSRSRLDTLLDRIYSRPLTLVCAPAGYGKTTSLSGWLQNQSQPSGWLALDESDNDLTQFAGYFLAAVQSMLPDFDVNSTELLDNSHGDLSPTIIDLLIDELDRIEQDCVLVLNDYHFISNPDIHAFLTQLLRHPNRGLHLVILTRHDPPLPLNGMRAGNQVVDIRAGDLRFSNEEVSTFMDLVVDAPMEEETISLLREKTEGWPTGLRLATLFIAHSGGDVQSFVEAPSVNNPYVMDYLAVQVMAGLPAHVQSFLVQTSILDRLSAPLCQAVVAADAPSSNAQAVLRELEQANLFTISLDNERHWYRYHHLFLQFLRDRLQKQYSPEAIAALHSRAGQWYAENGLVEPALRHLMAAGEARSAVQLVASHRRNMMNQERWNGLSRWLHQFPQAVIDESPDLLLAAAWLVFMQRYDLTGIAQLLDKVEALLRHPDLDPEVVHVLRAEMDTLRCILLTNAPDAANAIALGRRVLEALPDSDYIVRSYAWLHLAGAQQMNGDLNGAYESLQTAWREDLSLDDTPRGRNYGGQGFIQWMAGDLNKVANTGKHFLATVSPANLRQSLGWAHYFIAVAHYHRNDLVATRQYAQLVFDQRFVNPALANVYSAFMLASINQAEGLPRKALEHVAQAASYATEIHSIPLTLTVEAFQAELAVLQGRGREAVPWAKRAKAGLRPALMPYFYTPQLTVPKVFLAQDTTEGYQQAADSLAKLHKIAESLHNVRVLIEVLALEALLLDSQGREQAADEALARSLSLAQPGGFLRLYVDLGPRMAGLLRRLSSESSMADYVTRILDAFPNGRRTAASPSRQRTLIEPLTKREFEILALLNQRFSNKEIAAELVVSPVTVKRHTINIYQKLGVNTRRDAVTTALSLGLL